MGNFKLRTFALVHIAPEETVVYSQFKDKDEMVGYVQEKIDRSLVRADDAPSADAITKLFAFATCDNESWGRYILYAYVEDASGVDLKGQVGISTSKEGDKDFVEELEKKTDK